MLVVVLRNDALEGWELAVDHPGDQQAIADGEEQMVFAAGVEDISLPALSQQAPELQQRLARENDAILVAFTLALAGGAGALFLLRPDSLGLVSTDAVSYTHLRA